MRFGSTKLAGTLIGPIFAFAWSLGCGGPSLSDLRGKTGSVTRLEFATSSSISSNQLPSLHVSVTDHERAQAVYMATLALPAFPSGTYACPNDSGVQYDLEFFSTTERVMSAAEHPSGCEAVDVVAGSTSLTLWASTTPSYWGDLASALGIAARDLPR